MHPDNKLTINVVEASPLEDFSLDVRFSMACNTLDFSKYLLPLFQAVRGNLTEALKVANGNGSEEDKTEARIEADVYEAIQHALGAK